MDTLEKLGDVVKGDPTGKGFTATDVRTGDAVTGTSGKAGVIVVGIVKDGKTELTPISTPSSGTYILECVNGVVKWVAST